MRAKITTKVTGITEANETLRILGPDAARILMQQTVIAIAIACAEHAIANAPDDASTGAPDLRTSIKVESEPATETQLDSAVTVDKKGAFYWRFLEHGQGPDNVEYAFMLKSILSVKSEFESVFLTAFRDRYVALMGAAQ